jgi:apolipoprotein N-acyltransferase
MADIDTAVTFAETEAEREANAWATKSAPEQAQRQTPLPVSALRGSQPARLKRLRNESRRIVDLIQDTVPDTPEREQAVNLIIQSNVICRDVVAQVENAI